MTPLTDSALADEAIISKRSDEVTNTKRLSEMLMSKLRELSEKPDGWGDIRFIEPAEARSILAALAPPDAATTPHPDDEAVDEFAAIMKEKLADARAKGRSGWKGCNPADLSSMLREHVEKGDPRDVANYCMMLHFHRSSIAAPVAFPAQQGPALVDERHAQST